MSKMYLEVVTSKYRPGTSMRDKDTEYVELDLNVDIPEKFDSVENLKQTEAEILKVLQNYCSTENVVLGVQYNNAMVGTNMYQNQKYATVVFIERGEGYFRKVPIKNEPWFTSDPITLNWSLCDREYWEPFENWYTHGVFLDKGFRCAKRA